MKSETVKATELRSSRRDFSSTMLADPYILLWRCLPAIDFVELSLWHFQDHVECSHSMAAIDLALRLAVLLEAYASECCDFIFTTPMLSTRTMSATQLGELIY